MIIPSQPTKALKLRFHHWDCWATQVSEMLPEILFYTKSLGVEREGNKVRETLLCELFGQKEDISQAIRFIKKKVNRGMLSFIQKTDNQAKFMCTYQRPVKVSIQCHMGKLGIVPSSTFVHSNGYELHDWMCIYNPKEVIESFEKKGIVEIVSIKDISKSKKELTPAEELALKTAQRFGYYCWPRKITLDQLAEKIGLSRRGFQDNLRRAESKIMNKKISQII